MKKCLSEIMKELKELENNRDFLLEYETENSKTTYIKGEEKIPSTYNYNEVSKKLTNYNKREKYLRNLLTIANVETMLPSFNMSINEGLIYISQLTKNIIRNNSLSSAKSLDRRTTSRFSEIVEYTETNYDPSEARKEYSVLKNTLSRLQLEIDKTNLTTYIEVED